MVRELFHPAPVTLPGGHRIQPLPYWRIWAPFHGVMVLVATQPVEG